MLAGREETFGPVVSVEPVDSAEEAIELANDTPYGLNASVWGGDGDRARAIARRLDTGTAGVNSTLLIYNTFDVPMGGVKDSGSAAATARTASGASPRSSRSSRASRPAAATRR